MKEIRINIFELISSSAAVSSEDGEMLYRRIINYHRQRRWFCEEERL